MVLRLSNLSGGLVRAVVLIESIVGLGRGLKAGALGEALARIAFPLAALGRGAPKAKIVIK